MTKYKYQYLFALSGPNGTQIVRSSETEKSLIERAGTVNDKSYIADFIETGTVGSFIQLSTGEFIFQTA